MDALAFQQLSERARLSHAPHPVPRSATWPKEVKNIASQFVTNHTVHVFIGGVEDKLVANKAITQHVKVGSSGGGYWRALPCTRGPVHSGKLRAVVQFTALLVLLPSRLNHPRCTRVHAGH